jgi:hypothetical protein
MQQRRINAADAPAPPSRYPQGIFDESWFIEIDAVAVA